MALAPDETVIIACPNCGKCFRVGKKIVGRQVRCRACGEQWQAQVAIDLEGTTAGSSQLSGVNNSATNTNSASQTLSGSQITADDDASWIGQNLGRFTISDMLGKGAMGVVFLAHDPNLKRDVALKILAKQFIRSQTRTYRLEQFVREAQSAAKLSHPNSVTVFEIGQDKGWYFIAMELVTGGTMLDLIRKYKRKAPIEVVCELVAQACDALSAAHKLGIVHRDVKPSNIMLTKDCRAKVADFGLVQMATQEKSEFDLPSKAVGTPYWMSPEQCKGETAVPQSDIYSLGAVLYFALTGEVPYKAKNKRDILLQHVNAAVPDPRELRKDVPETLVRIIQRAMAKNPRERYQDAREMGIGLRQVAGNLAQSRIAERWWGRLASTGVTAETGGKPKRSLASILVPTMVLIIVIGGFLMWMFADKKPTQVAPATPPANVKPIIHVPVVIVPGRNIYHAPDFLECPILKNVPKENWIDLSSIEEAEKQGLAPCTYCQKELERRKKEADEKMHSD